MRSHIFVRMVIAAALSATLTACLFLPGEFRSDLDIASNGSFSYRYTGEIIFSYADGRGWRDLDESQIRCLDRMGKDEPCSADEIAGTREQWEIERARLRDTSKEVAAILGYDPFDKAQSDKLARSLESYPGWRSVQYRGGGVFDVVYEISGNLDREFVFPVIPEAPFIRPFVIVRRNIGNSVTVSAPGLSNEIMARLANAAGEKSGQDEYLVATRINGTFRIDSDGGVVDHNGLLQRNGLHQQGDQGSSVSWSIGNEAADAPWARIEISGAR